MLEDVLEGSLKILVEDVRVLLVGVAQLEHTVLQRVVEVAQLRRNVF